MIKKKYQNKEFKNESKVTKEAKTKKEKKKLNKVTFQRFVIDGSKRFVPGKDYELSCEDVKKYEQFLIKKSDCNCK